MSSRHEECDLIREFNGPVRKNFRLRVLHPDSPSDPKIHRLFNYGYYDQVPGVKLIVPNHDMSDVGVKRNVTTLTVSPSKSMY